MAGRGRQSTLPAWMTEGGGNIDLSSMSSTISGNPVQQGQFDDNMKIESKERSNGHSSGDSRSRPPSSRDDRSRKSRSRDRGHRSSRSNRSRSRDRQRDRDERPREKDREKRRSSSPGGGRGSGGGEKVWISRKNTRISNFDVRPPDGVELPGVGLGGLSTGVGLGGNPSQTGGGDHGYGLNRPVGGNSGGAGIYGNAMGSGLQGGMGDSAKQQQTRHARRLYVGGIPPGTVDEELNVYFNNVIARATAPSVLEGGPPVVQIYINPEKCFAFVELTSIELTTACLALDGMKYDHRAGTSIIRVRRPNDFKPELMPSNLQPLANFNLNVFGMTTTAAVDGPGKLFIGGLPYHLEDDQVKELLSAFGILKSFHLVRDPGSVTSKGYGFCEYLDLMTTQNAIEGLNNLAIGEKTLTVRIATNNTGGAPSQIMTHMQTVNPAGLGGIFTGGQNAAQQSSGMNMSMGMMGGMGMPPSIPTFADLQPTRVLKMANMVTAAELNDDAEYDDIKDDILSECAAYGKVLIVVIPRIKDGFSPSSEGLIFVEFREASVARTCAIALSGRKFGSRIVIVDYYDENRFADRYFG